MKHQPPAIETLKRSFPAITVIHFAGVVTEVKLCEIAMQMLSAYVMIDAINAAPKISKEPFDRIGCYADSIIPADVFFRFMVYLGMFAYFADALIAKIETLIGAVKMAKIFSL